MYGNAKRKLLGISKGGPSTPSKGGDNGDITADGDGFDPTTTPKKKATPRKRKTGTPKAGEETTGENGEGGSTDATPKPKRVRKTPAKKAPITPVKVKEGNSETDTDIEVLVWPFASFSFFEFTLFSSTTSHKLTNTWILSFDEYIVKDEPVETPGVDAAEPKTEESDDSEVKFEVLE